MGGWRLSAAKPQEHRAGAPLRFAPATPAGLSRQSLVERNRFDRADVDARAAIAARLGVDDRDVVHHGNRVQRAGVYTGFTTGASFRIHYCWHLLAPVNNSK